MVLAIAALRLLRPDLSAMAARLHLAVIEQQERVATPGAVVAPPPPVAGFVRRSSRSAYLRNGVTTR
jgi:hypothetical protein